MLATCKTASSGNGLLPIALPWYRVLHPTALPYSRGLLPKILLLTEAVLPQTLTLTGLRHSFLSSLEWSVLSHLDREEIASDMAHSVDQQELYRFVASPSKLPSKP